MWYRSLQCRRIAAEQQLNHPSILKWRRHCSIIRISVQVWTYNYAEATSRRRKVSTKRGQARTLLGRWWEAPIVGRTMKVKGMTRKRRKEYMICDMAKLKWQEGEELRFGGRYLLRGNYYIHMSPILSFKLLDSLFVVKCLRSSL